MENKNKNKYNLDFMQALKIVFEGGAVKGEGFMSSIFLKLNVYSQLVIVDAGNSYKESDKVFIRSMDYQKFREVVALTVRELSY